MTIKFIDMFCGIGGFRYGLERTAEGNIWQGTRDDITPDRDCPDIKNPKQGGSDLRQTFDCVWSNDNDKYAYQIYRKHFGEVCEQDIRAVDVDGIPEHDLLCAGFPCQSFSLAGKRRGFEDVRGTLFFEICRVIWAKRPGYLLLENVKGLLSHDDGSTFERIIGTLDELGYDCQWQVLNSKDFGVPQNRERVFIIGHLRGKSRPKVFPIGEDDTSNSQVAEPGEPVASSITARGAGEYHAGMQLVGKEMIVPTIRAEHHNTGDVHFIDAFNRRLTNLPTAIRQNMQDGGTLVAPSITTEMAHGTGFNQTPQVVKAIGQIRRLTPLECERLQGFPDGWTKGISDTQRYKCLGNAVTVNVIEAIGQRLIQEKK